MSALITQEFLRKGFLYEPETGDFYRKLKYGGWKIVGVTPNSDGYRRVGIFGTSYYIHRLIWLYMTGNWPPIDIDHVDRNPGNNRWNNLRLASRSQNTINSRLLDRNTSGVRGVCWNPIKSRWMARISLNGVRRHLGYFDSIEEAEQVYLLAAAELHEEYAPSEVRLKLLEMIK